MNYIQVTLCCLLAVIAYRLIDRGLCWLDGWRYAKTRKSNPMLNNLPNGFKPTKVIRSVMEFPFDKDEYLVRDLYSNDFDPTLLGPFDYVYIPKENAVYMCVKGFKVPGTEIYGVDYLNEENYKLTYYTDRHYMLFFLNYSIDRSVAENQ